MSEELFRRHRPKTLKTVFGQEKAVQVVKALLERGLPHQLLFTGPSGCGKTTLARILKAKLDCGDRDFSEINCADFRGIEMVRDIRRNMGLRPISGASRVWLIDEAHKMSGDAQNALLKILEDPPKHAYFFLATTEPAKLIRTIQTRCTEIACGAVSAQAARQLLEYVCGKENIKLPSEVQDKLIEAAEQSARKLLVLLQTVMGLPSGDDQLAAIISMSGSAQGIALARALIAPNAKWPDIQKILKTVDEEPETLRRMILGYANSILLGTSTQLHARAYALILAFSENFFDTGKSGLSASCYEMTRQKIR